MTRLLLLALATISCAGRPAVVNPRVVWIVDEREMRGGVTVRMTRGVESGTAGLVIGWDGGSVEWELYP